MCPDSVLNGGPRLFRPVLYPLSYRGKIAAGDGAPALIANYSVFREHHGRARAVSCQGLEPRLPV